MATTYTYDGSEWQGQMDVLTIYQKIYEGNGGYVGGPTMYSLYDMGSSGSGGGSGSSSGGGSGGVGGTGIPAGAKFINNSSQPGYTAYTANDVASFLQDTGDYAMIAGTVMVFTGFGAPLGAVLIAYGGYTSVAGTALELIDDANRGTWSNEKFITKGVLELIPSSKLGGKMFNYFGAPTANELLNLGTIGADRLLDEFRNVNAGPYRKN